MVSSDAQENMPNNARATMITTADNANTKIISRTGINFSVQKDGEKRLEGRGPDILYSIFTNQASSSLSDTPGKL